MITKEQPLQQALRAEASACGALLWRNNVGAFQCSSGRWVRYGLANDSPAMNARVKSSDLIGVEPVLITPAMVGSVFGRFVAREVKPPGWVWAGTEREVAQDRFLRLVTARGGNACFSASLGTISPRSGP